MLKKIIYTAVIGLSMLTSTPAFSGAGHHHGPATPPTNEQIISKSVHDIKVIVDKFELVEGEKLDASWKNVTDKKVHKKSLRYFVTAFTHPEEKRTLYILMTSQGGYLGANFSGNFEEF